MGSEVVLFGADPVVGELDGIEVELQSGAVWPGALETPVVVAPGEVSDGPVVGPGSALDTVVAADVSVVLGELDAAGATPFGAVTGAELAHVSLAGGAPSEEPVEELPQLAVSARSVQVGNALPKRWVLAPNRRKHSRTGNVMPRYAAPREIDRLSFPVRCVTGRGLGPDRVELHDRRDSG